MGSFGNQDYFIGDITGLRKCVFLSLSFSFSLFFYFLFFFVPAFAADGTNDADSCMCRLASG
jgi:hypothetical protein